jgi:hypothetical protein
VLAACYPEFAFQDGGGAGGGGAGAATTGAPASGPGAGTSMLSGSSSAGGMGGGPSLDLDRDGLDDDYEASIAAAYRPFLSVSPDDGCPLGGIVYRVRPHPYDTSRVHIVYDHLFERDCGLGGHIGDNEAFGVTVDPAVPAPAGIVAIVAIGHQGTLCEQVSSCGNTCGLDACNTAPIGGDLFPIVYTSVDKHAGYVGDPCSAVNCFDACELAPASADPPMVNAGEPGAPLVSNLTTEGFINAQNGWAETELFDIDPWDTTVDFGGAGNIAGDLTDDAFVPPPCN